MASRSTLAGLRSRQSTSLLWMCSKACQTCCDGGTCGCTCGGGVHSETMQKSWKAPLTPAPLAAQQDSKDLTQTRISRNKAGICMSKEKPLLQMLRVIHLGPAASEEGRQRACFFPYCIARPISFPSVLDIPKHRHDGLLFAFLRCWPSSSLRTIFTSTTARACLFM